MSDALMAVAFPAVMGVLVAVVVSQVLKAAERGDLPRSGAVGIRTSATKASDEAWAAGHAAAVPVARNVTLLTSVVAVVVIVLGFTVDAGWVMAIAVVPLALAILGLIPVVRSANRAARAAQGGKGKKK